MSPYEIIEPGGSVEHWNEEAGAVWLQRLLDHYERAVWINPVREGTWDWTSSIGSPSNEREDAYERSSSGCDSMISRSSMPTYPRALRLDDLKKLNADVPTGANETNALRADRGSC